MKLIKKITDKDILGTEGLSTKSPRITARAILKNKNGMFAVMYAEKFNLYSLPGGGVEDGEDAVEAVKREIWEETGCRVTSLAELGRVEENRAHCDYTQIDYYFVLTTNDELFHPHLTDNERKNRTTAKWLSAYDMYQKIAFKNHTTNQQKFLQARDVAALEEYFQINDPTFLKSPKQ